MGYYKILSTPRQPSSPNYKGLYRNGPYPPSNYYELNRFMSLWERYAHDSPGITTELTLDELKELAELATTASGEHHEVIYHSERDDCPYEAECYGIDVAGMWYSLMGYWFMDSKKFKDKTWKLIVSQFEPKVNSNVLFDKLDDALSFCAVLEGMLTIDPNCIENEDWRARYIFRVK